MSTVEIIVDGTDYTNACLFNKCTFQQSMAAVPGTFQITVRDPDRSLTFVTGVEISLEIDGVRMFGGYVTQVGMSHLAPAADTSDLGDYNLRVWNLRGTDYNIIFDKRVVRDTADYLSYVEITETMDGAILRSVVDNYADMSDFDTSGIEDIASIPDGDVIQQGIKIRDRFENLSYFGGAIWYADGNKNIIYRPYEDVEKRWGFSDIPNHNGITASPDEFQGATMGFRQVEATEDSTGIVNDALIWGGSEFAGAGGTVFSRQQDATSQSTYGRWQYAETHFGETNYKTQYGVDARADVLVLGPPGTDIYGEQKGLRYPQWQFDFTWFSVDVPELSGTPDHLVAGDIVTIEMQVFDVTKLLPLRSLRISFPDAMAVSGDPDDRVVQFDGSFGLQLGDPFTLWRYIQKAEVRVNRTVNTVLATAVTNDSPTTTYGAYYRGEPSPTTDGSETNFVIPFGYVTGSTQVYLNGLLQRPSTDYAESDSSGGVITMVSPPESTDNLLVLATTIVGNSTTIPPLAPSGDVFYIDTSGSDTTGDGSIGNPWATVSKFLALPPAPGNTLYMRAGTYTGSGNTNLYTEGKSGTAGNPITIANYPSETVTIDGEGVAFADDHREFLVGRSSGGTPSNYWTIDGLRFVNMVPTQTGIIQVGLFNETDPACTGWIIRNCYFHMLPQDPGVYPGDNNGNHAVYIGGKANNCVIEDNEMVGHVGLTATTGSGIHIYHSSNVGTNWIAQRNIIHGYQEGFLVWDPDHLSAGTVEHNTFFNNTTDADMRYHGTVLFRDNVSDGTGTLPYDPYDSGSTTTSNNYGGETLTGSGALTVGSSAINGAHDGSDAGAIPYP